jgi:hypothetical protein
VDSVESLRWRLRAFWHATLALFGISRAPRLVAMRVYRKGNAPVRTEPPPRPAWAGPPDDEVGVAVGTRTVLASQPRLFIAITDCAAYSNGFTLALALRSKDDIPPHAMGFGPTHDPDDDSGIQIGIRFSDGREARSTGVARGPMMRFYRAWSEGDEPDVPEEPLIVQRSGGGGGRHFDFNYFIWPLPPDGPVTITCRWPARGLQTAGKQLNGTAIRAAGLKSKSVWD